MLRKIKTKMILILRIRERGTVWRHIMRKAGWDKSILTGHTNKSDREKH